MIRGSADGTGLAVLQLRGQNAGLLVQKCLILGIVVILRFDAYIGQSEVFLLQFLQFLRLFGVIPDVLQEPCDPGLFLLRIFDGGL